MKLHSLSRSLTSALGALALAGAAGLASAKPSPDRPEPGLQGQTMPGEAVVLPVPYSKGLRRIGHQPIGGRDSNVQLAWAGHCAYVSSTGGPFPLIGAMKADKALLGVAVIDVKNPRKPRLVKLLRDKGSSSAVETFHAVSSGSRSVLVAGDYHGGSNTPGTSGSAEHDPKSTGAWLSIYDVSDCANPRLMSEIAWPQNSHTVRLSPDGTLVYGTAMSPFTGEGGLQVMDISDLARPRFLGKFGAVRPDGSAIEFASHEVSFSLDGKRIYAGVNASKGGDLNQGLKLFPPSPQTLGNNGGGVYILDNSDFLDRRADPRLRLIGTMPGGGWHSVVPARIGGRAYLVGGAELGGCPGTWPRITDISDEANPVLAGEFRLAMNRTENCPGGKAGEGVSGIIPVPGTATLHYNAVDSAADTRLGLFNFMWGGLRVADLRDPHNPKEIAYFKPGDVCTGHVRHMAKTGHIWLVCNASGFHVLALTDEAKKDLREPGR